MSPRRRVVPLTLYRVRVTRAVHEHVSLVVRATDEEAAARAAETLAVQNADALAWARRTDLPPTRPTTVGDPEAAW